MLIALSWYISYLRAAMDPIHEAAAVADLEEVAVGVLDEDPCLVDRAGGNPLMYARVPGVAPLKKLVSSSTGTHP
jgi:hypothetical protein